MSPRVKGGYIPDAFISSTRCINCGRVVKDPFSKVSYKGEVKGKPPVCSKECLEKALNFGFKLIKSKTRRKNNEKTKDKN